MELTERPMLEEERKGERDDGRLADGDIQLDPDQWIRLVSVASGTFCHVTCFHPPGPLGFGRTLPKTHLFLRS